jgi:ferredoxin--NADP+ reductase
MGTGRSSLKQKMKVAVLIDRVEVCGPDVDIFRIKPKEGELFSFAPGQYVTLGLNVGDEFVARAYSIASSPYQRDFLELYINVVEEGQFTPPLFKLNEGDELYYMGPKGIFTLKKTQAKHLFFIATGTGLAPYISMVRTMFKDWRAGKPHDRVITLVHGVRHSQDLGYRDELAAIARNKGFDFVYIPMVSRPNEDPSWTHEFGRGRITELIKLLGSDAVEQPIDCLPRNCSAPEIIERLPPESTAVFLCGNPDMIKDAKEQLAAKGYGELYTEEYW